MGEGKNQITINILLKTMAKRRNLTICEEYANL